MDIREFANGVTQREIKSKLRGFYFQEDPSLFQQSRCEQFKRIEDSNLTSPTTL